MALNISHKINREDRIRVKARSIKSQTKVRFTLHVTCHYVRRVLGENEDERTRKATPRTEARTFDSSKFSSEETLTSASAVADCGVATAGS